MSERPLGRIKSAPEDFVVEEVPAYAPSGDGGHVFVRFTKRNLTTDGAMRAICAALGADARACGAAGMKDKVAVTTQTISVEAPRGIDPSDLAVRARALSIDGITIHEATRHPHKMKPGHLEGNRFTIVVRGIARDRVSEVRASLEGAAREGIPNHFGAQRFGRGAQNVEQARAWLSGKARAPRDKRIRRLLWSALQSAVFNAVLDARVRDGTWAVPLEGDLLKRRTSGGLFLSTDVQTDRDRAITGEVSPTGPIVGVKMRAAEGAPLALETAIAAQVLGEGFDLGETKRLGEGSRRALRLWIDDLQVTSHAEVSGVPAGEQEESLRVYFVLPKGAYATTVLATALTVDEPDPSVEHAGQSL